VRPWPKHPSIYEINTWVWLDELGRAAGRALTLASVPDREWDAVAALGFDAVWLMGVWERSPAGIAVANRNEGLLADFKRALPDFRIEDNVGSPYCVRRYVVDAHLGGREALAKARAALARRGMRLVLDFVPNHVAPDHPWVTEHPEYFIQGSADDQAKDPASFIALGSHVFACGRDPYFPAWPDVLQLNAFEPKLRAAVIDAVREIAGQCDAIRCDMAMLMLNAVFEGTWRGRAGAKPRLDYWRELIPAVRTTYPEFKFIAEAYWDLEWELQQQGFDYCYDKRLYDRLEHDNAETVRLHLCADLAYQEKLVRFIENHDEPRAAASFPSAKARAVAVTALTQCGARLVHEGQLEGRCVRLPVFLARRPDESPDESLRDFYRKLLRATAEDVFHNGEWRLCQRTGWPDNASFLNILAWCLRKSDDRCLIVVNPSDAQSQASVQVPWDDVAGHTWRLEDVMTGATFERRGDDMRGPGLYVDLPPWGYHFFRLHPT
jgi:Alpha amylase, catalytic domain